MVNYAVIGCGVIGEVHCYAIHNNRKSNLLAVCDIIPEKAAKQADLYNCKAAYNYKEILLDQAVDAVVICLPHSDHAWLFEEALHHRKHIICEKPLAVNPEDLYRMVELSENTDLLTTAGFQHRFSPLIHLLQSYINQGVFGEILSGEVDFVCERTLDYYNSDLWHGKWETEGGGLLINQAIHTIDLAKSFLGTPLSLSGRVENKHLPEIEVEDSAAGQILFENNRSLSIQAKNRKGEEWQPILKIKGTQGSFIIKSSNEIVELKTNSQEINTAIYSEEKLMQDDESLPGKKCYGNLHDLVYSDFSEAVLNNGKPYLSIREASAANEIVLGMYQSTTKGATTVTFPIKEYRQPILNNNSM